MAHNANYAAAVSGPLNGLKIVELAGIGPTPFACMLLADLGANVLRLERGDPDEPPEVTGNILHRSRYSVAVNLKKEAGRELVLELCEQADAIIEGFRPGVMERLGLGPDIVLRRNSRLVYARMTGYGQQGPLSPRAGHDINYVAVSGALWPLGRKGDKPTPPLNLVGDFGGGALYLVFGVLAAIISARATGEGQVVDAAMVDGSASMMAMTHVLINQGEWFEERGANLLDTGAHFYEVYETLDQKYVAVGAIEPQFYEQLLRGLDLRDVNLPAQMDRQEWPAMKERLASIFVTKTRDQWTDIFEETDACVTPVLTPTEAVNHPYNTKREVFSIDGVIQPRPAPRFSKTPGSIRQPARTAGAGTREGLLGWGIGPERADALKASGAFK